MHLFIQNLFDGSWYNGTSTTSSANYQEKYTGILTLLNPGSMLPESTTTTGDSLPVIHVNPFQIISADDTIKPT